MRITRGFLGLLALVVCAASQAQDGPSQHAAAPLRFSTQSPVLPDTRAVKEWVFEELEAQLGLSGSHHIEVETEPQLLNEHTVYRLKQMLDGLPVVRRDFKLILDEDRRPFRLLGRQNRIILDPPSSRATFPSHKAALKADPSGVYLQSNEADPPLYELVYWPGRDGLRLSYEFDAGLGERVYVDAHSGKVLQRIPLDYRAQRHAVDFAAACSDDDVGFLLSYRGFDRVATGARQRHSRSASSVMGSLDVEKLFEILGEFDQFLSASLEMNSFDGRGAPLVGFVGATFGEVHWPQCVAADRNASWKSDLRAAFFHSDLIDRQIVGHEFGHGIIDAIGDLAYQGQSGSLHESIADVIGISFGVWQGNQGVSGGGLSHEIPASDWQILIDGALARDMRSPWRVIDPTTKLRYPDHFDKFRITDADNGGVHVNSSIMNHGFYLLAEGGQHRRLRSGPTVQGIGLESALRIYVGGVVALPDSQAGFEAARYAFAVAAEAIFGLGSPEWIATHTAMDAIGIPGTRSP